MTDLSTVQDTGSTWARGVVSKDKAPTNPVLGRQREVGNQKTSQMTSKTATPSEVTSDQATSAFTKLAPVLDLIVPNAGDTGSLTAKLKIPVKGAFVGIHIGATVSRTDDGSVSLGVTANVTAGATIGIATATFELGAYLQAQGKDSSQAMVIVSWVLYRQLAESNAPREVEQAWFGDKKGTAEQWDAKVRKTLFTKESGNWAEVGGQVTGSAGITTGALTATVKGKLRMGRKYDAESIERREGSESTTQKFAKKLGIDRGAQASLGDRVFSVIGSATISSPLAKGSIQVTVAVRQVKDKRKGQESTTYELSKIEVTGTASCAGMGSIASYLAGGKAVQDLVSKVAAKASTASKKAKKELPREATSVASDVDSYANGLLTAESQLTGVTLQIPDVSATGQIHVVGGLDDGKPGLKVMFEKLTKLTVKAGVFSLTAKKTERLASIEYSDGTWTARLGTLSKEFGGKQSTTGGGGKSTTPSTTPGTNGKGKP